jgi:hypothetical protein
MPYKSEAQRKYFNVNRKKLEAQGVDVDEWNEASKGKKMPERVKKSFVVKLAALSAEEINDMETTSGLLSDFIPVSSSRRSGRSRLMAEAADVPAPYRINRPDTSTLTDSFLASLAGGAIGGPPGAIGGAGVGYWLNKLIARGQKKNINEEYEDQRLSGELKSPTKPEGVLSTLLNPAMRIGEQQAYGAIKADRKIPNVSKVRAALEASLAGIPTSIYDTATALTNTDNDLDDRKSQRLAKAGSFTTISKLAEASYKAAQSDSLEHADKEKKKRRSSNTYAKALGLGGVGALALGRGIGKADDIALAQNALNSFNPAALNLNAKGDDSLLDPSRTGLTEYISTLAPVANLKPWGIPPSIPLSKLRQQEDILSAMGVPKDYVLSDPSAIAQGKMHYDSFGAGPIPAFYHMFRKNLRNTPMSVDEAKTLGLPDNTRYGDWLERKFEDFVQQEYNNKPVLPFEVNNKQLSIPKQQAMLDKFMLSLSPEEQAIRRKYEKARLVNAGTPQEFSDFSKQVKSYSTPAKALLGLRKGLYTAGGAGVGGYAGNKLYSTLGGENPYLKALATTAGAGVGGISGNYISDPEVQQNIRNKIQELASRAATKVDNNLGIKQNLGNLLSSLITKGFGNKK